MLLAASGTTAEAAPSRSLTGFRRSTGRKLPYGKQDSGIAWWKGNSDVV